MKKIRLKEVIKEEKYAHLVSVPIEIKDIKISTKEMKLFINLESSEIISVENLNGIKKYFEKSFEKLKTFISIEFKIDIKSIENQNKYIKNIKDYISSLIPSSLSWIEELSYDFDKDKLLLEFPNDMSFSTLQRQGIMDKLKTKIKHELNLNLETSKNVCNIYNNKFLENKLDEEKIISKTILENSSVTTSKKRVNSPSKNYSFGKEIKGESLNISEINLQTGTCIIKGEIFDINSKEIRGNKLIITFYITDKKDSTLVKVFLKEDEGNKLLNNLEEEMFVLLQGDVVYDNFSRSQVVMLKSLRPLPKIERMDNSIEKRVELHLHTQMSSMDGIANVKKLINQAHKWGHSAVAVTDHGVVQAFPEAMDISQKIGIKVLYGLEGYLVNDEKKIISDLEFNKEYDGFVIFDIETTGLSAINDSITEIGAIKVKEGKVIDRFSQLINPERPIPEFITKLTGITDTMVEDKPTIENVVPTFSDFIENSILVAHNASCDVGFIRENFKKANLTLSNPILDTLELSRAVFTDLKNHKLNTLAKHLDVNLDNHHRAVDDAKATKDIFLKIMELLEEKGIKDLHSVNNLNTNKDITKDSVYHVTILAKNLTGLKNLYSLVSDSHIKYFHRRPRISKSLLDKNREGLLIGSACESGELFKGLLSNKSYSEIRNIINFYDYLEIQPLDNNKHLLRNGLVKNYEQLQKLNKKIYDLGKKYNKLVVATGDVHFLNPEDEVYRRILMTGQGFSDADDQPPLYFKTTEEMIKEFSYLGKDKAYEVVIKNTNLVNDMIEDIQPIPSGTFPPIIEGSEEELQKITYNKAYEIYGDPLPEIVEKRLCKELGSIIENGYAVMYIISQKLVWKSLEDGYLVGSRGSVGSSFVATMSGITEVNPLEPHYICPKCQLSEFFEGGDIASGSDLPDKNCPNCGTFLNKDGQDIPFEVFLGFEGDKEPDIDLNFAGEYQPKAHQYTEDLFGEGYVFRAGTIGTIADKTAYGFVKKYFEQKELFVNPAEINRLVKGCTGIKRSSGQHPGGVMIVPKHKDILDFTPIQYPANDKKSGVITTHFDYNAISSNILKLDILGHDVPTIIKMLEDITGIDPTSIALDEKATMQLFHSIEPLGIEEKDINSKVGTLGIPEFGTKFVRQMLIATQPTTFSELVRISGLSHGTDVWVNNAQNLVKDKIATLPEVISTREDIMLTLINAGIDKKKAFWIMEHVRKGKGLTEEEEKEMKSLNLPSWYIDSCNKIKYMFPKAHAVAYVMMSFRIAYFKVYYPEAFYATFFTTKAADFDAQLILEGPSSVNRKIEEIESLGNDATAKEKNLLTVLEVVREMYARGFKFQNVDLYDSDSDKFLIGENGIIPPLKGLDGVGENAAKKIVEERSITKFISIEDLVKRGKVSRTVIDALTEHGCLANLPESNQISLFSI
ncbi:MAG: PolC-type DNA polymerase III [Tissierella sp.]|uniref:PolC-type DNA polymerase III n=1 Tax=Tissierella sp. TaxID=41274 RepID=UPI003F997A25